MKQSDKNIEVILKNTPIIMTVKEIPYTNNFKKLIAKINKLKIKRIYDLKKDFFDSEMIILSDENNKLVFLKFNILFSDKNSVTYYYVEKNKAYKIKLLLAKIMSKYFQGDPLVNYLFEKILVQASSLRNPS